MSTEPMLAAAAKLREYAAAADAMYRDDYRTGRTFDTWYAAMSQRIHDNVLDFVALMSPELGTALADWLEGCAALSDYTDAIWVEGGSPFPTGRHLATAVARLVLRDESES